MLSELYVMTGDITPGTSCRRSEDPHTGPSCSFTMVSVNCRCGVGTVSLLACYSGCGRHGHHADARDMHAGLGSFSSFPPSLACTKGFPVTQSREGRIYPTLLQTWGVNTPYCFCGERATGHRQISTPCLAWKTGQGRTKHFSGIEGLRVARYLRARRIPTPHRELYSGMGRPRIRGVCGIRGKATWPSP